MRRGLAAALALSLLGGVLLLAGAGRTWATLRLPGLAPLPDTVVAVTGATLAPGVRALALLGLAGVPALLAARRTGRVVLGLLLAVAGVAAVAQVLAVLGDLTGRVLAAQGAGVGGGGGPGAGPGLRAVDPAAVSGTAAPYACLLGGLLLLAAGGLTVVRGRAWASLGARYEPPVAGAPVVGPPVAGLPVAGLPGAGAPGAGLPGAGAPAGGAASPGSPTGAPAATGTPAPAAGGGAPTPPGASPPPLTDKAVWDALDRGEDPTR